MTDTRRSGDRCAAATEGQPIGDRRAAVTHAPESVVRPSPIILEDIGVCSSKAMIRTPSNPKLNPKP